MFPIYDTSLSSHNGALIGGLYRNSARGIPNGNTIHDGINGSVPTIVANNKCREQHPPTLHADSFSSEIEESITISNQSASSVTKVNTRMAATTLSRKASAGSASTPDSLRNSLESVVRPEKVNGFAGIENRGFVNSTDELSKTNVLVHPDIHAEHLRNKNTSTRTETMANPVGKDYRQSSTGPINNSRNSDRLSDDLVTVSDIRLNILKVVKNEHSNGIFRSPKGENTSTTVSKDPETGQFETSGHVPEQVEYYTHPKSPRYYTEENNHIDEVGRMGSMSPDLVQGSPKPTNRRKIHSKKSIDNRSKVYVANGNFHQKSIGDDVTVQLSTISDRVHANIRRNDRPYENDIHLHRGQTLTRHFSDDSRSDGNIGRSSVSSEVSSGSEGHPDTRVAISTFAYDDRMTQGYITPPPKVNGNLKESLPHNGMYQRNGRTNYSDDYQYQISDDRDLPNVTSLNEIADDYPLESFSMTL